MCCLDVVSRCLYLLLQLLYLIHGEGWHSFGMYTSVTWCLSLMTLIFSIRHPLIVLEIFFLHLFQFPFQISSDLFPSLAALLFIILVLCDWHRHHSVVFASRWRLRYRSIERKLINKPSGALLSPDLSFLSNVLRLGVLTDNLGDFCRNRSLLLIVNIGRNPLCLLRQLGLHRMMRLLLVEKLCLAWDETV